MIEYKKVDGSFDLSGKSAVVVGGGGGIGGATGKCMRKKARMSRSLTARIM